MTKYFQVDRAFQLFEEAQSKEIPLQTETYNSLIAVTHFLKESYELRWSFVLDMLSIMNKNNLAPNLGTLNAILETLSTMGGNKNTRDYVMSVLAEFKKLNIEPCLASWYYVLIVFCKESKSISL